MSAELQELKERIGHLTDEQLLEMVGGDPDDYRPEALAYAKAELTVRGIDFEKTPEKEVQRNQESATPELSTPQSAAVCSACGGGRLRSGTLVAEKELTLVFTDNREERFVKVRACIDCGQLSLVADYDTEVQP